MSASVWDLLHSNLIKVVAFRWYFTKCVSILQRMPGWLELNEENGSKMPESCWKGCAYFITWIWSVYIMVTRPRIFFEPDCHWSGTCVCVMGPCQSVLICEVS